MRTVRFNAIGLGALAATTALGVGYFIQASTPTLAQAKSQDNKCAVCSGFHAETFTGTFRQATPADVVEWINEKGIHLKVDYQDLPKSPLTLAFDNLDEQGVVLAFGKSVGMQPVNRDGVYSLMRGVGGDSTSEPLGSEDSQERSKFRVLIGPDGSLSHGLRMSSLQDRDEDIEIVFGLDFDDEFDFDFDFDFDWDEDFDFDFEGLQDFNFQIPDVGKIIEEVMAALKDAGIGEGDQKLTDDQKAKLKASLKERLGGLHERMGGMNLRLRGLGDGMHLKELMELRGLEMGKLEGLMELRGLEMGKLEGLMELRGLQDSKLKRLFEMDLDKMRHDDGRELTDKEKQDVKKAMADARKAMEEAMKNFNSEGFRLRMSEGMKAQEKAMLRLQERFGKDGEGLRFGGFDSEAFEKMMQEQFGKDGKGLRFGGFDSEAFEKMMKGRFGNSGEGLQLRGFDSEGFAKMMQERFGENGELQKSLKEMNGKLKIQMKDIELKLENLRKFMDSLTDEQKALAKKQGHLNWSDLTKKQQELLGDFGKEGGTIRFNMDDRNVTIKKDNKKGGISA